MTRQSNQLPNVSSQPPAYGFAEFRLDLRRRRLERAGEVVAVTPKCLDILGVLVEKHGQLVEKDELMNRVWPDSFVEEANLTQNVFLLRKALGEGTSGDPFIETVPKRGYRFVAPVSVIEPEAADLDITEQTKGRMVIEERIDGGLIEAIVSSGPSEGSTPIKSPTPSDLRPRAPESVGQHAGLSYRWAVAAVLVALIVAGLWLLGKWDSTHPQIKSLAVLPLENLSGDPTQEYFADGMTEALIINLAQIRALKVISRTSVMRYKGSRRSLLPEIARELNVDAVIEGSVQRSSGRVRVTAQLIHAATDAHLWGREYERELSDVLKLQSEVAQAVADEIRIQVTPEERARLASAQSINPAAHEEYLLGKYYRWKLNEEDLKRAVHHFERATQIDPNYAAAYAGLSIAWFERGIWGTSNFKEVLLPSRMAARRAMELDDRLAEAYVAQGNAKFMYDWDWTGAEKDLRRALELDPNNLDANFRYAVLLQALGRFPESISRIERAEQLDPLSSTIHSDFGRILYRARKFEEAILHLQRAIELEPRNYGAYVRLGDVYAQIGRYDLAIANIEKGKELQSGGADLGFTARLACVYAKMGKRDQALRTLEKLKATTESSRLPLAAMAAAYAALGAKNEAFELLLRLVDKHSLGPFIKVDPPLDNLHSDPRWQALLRRMNFPVE